MDRIGVESGVAAIILSSRLNQGAIEPSGNRRGILRGGGLVKPLWLYRWLLVIPASRHVSPKQRNACLPACLSVSMHYGKAQENIHGSALIAPEAHARFCIDFWLFLVICIIGEEVKFFLIFPFHLSLLSAAAFVRSFL